MFKGFWCSRGVGSRGFGGFAQFEEFQDAFEPGGRPFHKSRPLVWESGASASTGCCISQLEAESAADSRS